MLTKHYHKIFVAKIVIGILASIWFLLYYSMGQQQDISAIVFVIDMQESMGAKDIQDSIWLPYTRQETAIKYISHVVQTIDTGMDIGIIRLGYYPDYIVPLTRDRETLGTYITSLADAPLSPTIVYQTGDISLEKYYNIAPTAKYILLTDKQSTYDAVKNMMSWIDAILIDPTSNQADIQEREDAMQTVSYRQWWYLWWIFVLITIVWLVLL